jgi:hypothetical protein
MTTAAALAYRAFARAFKNAVAAWPRQNRSAGTILSRLATLSDERLRLFDEQFGCRSTNTLPVSSASSQILKTPRLVEPVKGRCVIPFAPLPLRRGALEKKSASVLP